MTPEQSELKALGFDIPDSVTPVIAYRSWRIYQGNLCSHNGTVWTPGKALKAECIYGEPHHIYICKIHSKSEDPSTVPMKGCTCGLYSAKREEASRIVPHHSVMFVHGEIFIWGKILESHNGYRTEYAYPKQFFATSEVQKLELETMGFGVPVVLSASNNGLTFPFPPETA